MKRALSALALVAALALAAPAPTYAQDSSAPGAVAHLKPEQAAVFGKQIERDLASRGARVAMVFRSGRPKNKLPEGIGYTHGAFWVYRDITAADGRKLNGYAVYNLYHGDGETLPKSQSYLKQDFPTDFTLGSAIDEVAVIVPSPEMQRRLLAVIDSPDYAALHNPNYSLVANPLSDRYQNCNGFMLNVLSEAAWATNDKKQILANLKAHFQPTLVKAGALARVFGPMADPRLRTDDHKGPLRTTTYESLAHFMATNKLLADSYVLTRAGA